MTHEAREAEEREPGQGPEKVTADAILTVIRGDRYKGDDPGEAYKANRTPNQKPLRMVAGYAVNAQRKKLLAANRYRDEFVAYCENQRAIGFQCSDGDPAPEAATWNLCEIMTATHWNQWATAYYGALWLGLEYKDDLMRAEGEWFLGSELYFYHRADPLFDGKRTGRVILACARAKGTERPGKPKPFVVENVGRNQVWRMANGMPRDDSRRHRTRLETAQDAANIVARCMTRGWDFPEVPKTEPKLFSPLAITQEEWHGSLVVTQLVDAPGPQVVGRLAIQETLFDVATGVVEAIHIPPQAETPE